MPLPPGGVQDLTDETVSVGSPRMSYMKLPDVPENVTAKIKTNIGQNIRRHPGMSLEQRHSKKLSYGGATKRQLRRDTSPTDYHAISSQ